jgi:hypothetical protein
MLVVAENPLTLEAPPTRTAGARPPSGPPPGRTTFASEPDDSDRDPLVVLKDNVDRLLRQSRQAPGEAADLFLDLLDQRRKWIQTEMDAEKMLQAPPGAPLDIPEDPYDLSSLVDEFGNPRLKAYRGLLDQIETTRFMLENEIADKNSDCDTSE